MRRDTDEAGGEGERGERRERTGERERCRRMAERRRAKESESARCLLFCFMSPCPLVLAKEEAVAANLGPDWINRPVVFLYSSLLLFTPLLLPAPCSLLLAQSPFPSLIADD